MSRVETSWVHFRVSRVYLESDDNTKPGWPTGFQARVQCWGQQRLHSLMSTHELGHMSGAKGTYVDHY